MNHKKMIAPAVITAVLVLLLIFYMALWSIVPMPFLAKLAVCVILALLIGVAVYNLMERFREIRSGEEDDLSKY